MKQVMVVAGGTGGHIFPALAVADALSQQGYGIFWLGARYGLEATLVAKHYDIELLTVKGLRRRGWLAKLLMPWQVLRSTFKAYRIIKKRKPSVVLAMGGYVSAPGGLAAWLARVPLVIHEQNSRAGLTNRWLAKLARVKLQAFDGAFPKTVCTKTIGNPIRASLLNLSSPEQRYVDIERPLRILIMGGSQGARAINQCMLDVWPTLADLSQVSVWHQTGKADFQAIAKKYQSLEMDCKVEPFIENMDEAYAFADLVVCRSGAMSVSELAAVGLASILVPYPNSVDDHQYYNAFYLAAKDAAILCPQFELNPKHMQQWVDNFISCRQDLQKMAQFAKQLAYLDATNAAASACIRCMAAGMVENKG